MVDLLRVYGDCWGGEAGEWNTSVQNKYLEYMFARFLEENFVINPDDSILNIGIGAGYWDRYLSYKVPNGLLTSVDIDRSCADNLKACLQNERNENPVRVICADAISYDFGATFDLVTMVGSAAEESGNVQSIISKAFSLLKENGTFYLQLIRRRSSFDIDRWAAENHASIVARLVDDTYDIHCEYYKIKKVSEFVKGAADV